MGLLGRLFGWNNGFVEAKPVPSPNLDAYERAYPYLRKATQLKKEGDIEAAISSLRTAYGIAGKDIGVDERIRLPQYLQIAGRNDEAWKEFNDLIIEAGSSQIKELAYFDLENIYDKMRLFLQREGRFIDAIGTGVLSYTCFVRAVFFQATSNQKVFTYMREERTKQLAFITEEGFIEKMVFPLLKKAGKEKYLDDMKTIIFSGVKKLPDVSAVEAISINVNNLLGNLKESDHK